LGYQIVLVLVLEITGKSLTLTLALTTRTLPRMIEMMRELSRGPQ